MTLEPRQEQFFSLLRSGLWGTEADASLFDASTDWMALFQIAKSQSTLALVYDGILTLPRELRPERRLFLQWSNIVAQIEEENDHLNDRLHEVFRIFQDAGLSPVLLKGQGVAQCYRQPEHRQCGDIDVFIGKRDYEKANALLRKEATSEHQENEKHTGFHWRDVEVETHRLITRLSDPWANRHFQHEVSRWFPHGHAVPIKGQPVETPPTEFNVLFLIVHATYHLLEGGIGLRQVSDWACLLHASHATMRRPETVALLRKCGFLRAAKAFGAIAVDVLGLEANQLPFTLSDSDRHLGEWLLQDILRGGNFGHYRPEGTPRSAWLQAFRRCYLELGRLAPREAFWHPILLIPLSIRIKTQRLMSALRR